MAKDNEKKRRAEPDVLLDHDVPGGGSDEAIEIPFKIFI
jgi:predicted component of type VI protein secretion system